MQLRGGLGARVGVHRGLLQMILLRVLMIGLLRQQHARGAQQAVQLRGMLRGSFGALERIEVEPHSSQLALRCLYKRVKRGR